ncbi:MAG: family 31 glucosidase [Lachnospiraceae bacterium]|nr:family 31 glucosidase [Lachnospiraceae bacterium]
MNYFKEIDGSLLFKRRKEIVEITPWGTGLRVRATQNHAFSGKNWALDTPLKTQGTIQIEDKRATITNGKITAVITVFGKISFYNQDGKLLLKEYYRSWDYGTENWEDLDQIVMVKMAARTYKSVGGDNYHTTVRFEAHPDEKIFGMGQYQHSYLNLKGCSLEMAQKNTQASVPFAISNLGYGFFWNNPAVGRATFGHNITEWDVESCREIQYWATAGDTPAEILENYTAVTGRPPMMPDYALGFWQCKLRYQTQEELLAVAREYYKRKIPVKVMVVDFFHWPQQGDWCYDKNYWPNPKKMAEELNEMGMKLMVSVWPTVDRASIHYQEMMERDLLVRCDRGIPVTMDCFGMEQFIDVTNPEAREYIWNICKENYRENGVELFWFDEAEPEFTHADFDIYRYYDGPALECANEYPVQYARAFYEGMQTEGVKKTINLIRCAWAGAAKYGALVWSGDVPSTFTQLRNQFTAGINMGLAGIPWWTADIGGFHGGNIHDPNFHELLMRWFQLGAFLPVMRLHGDRDPHDKKPLGFTGGGMCGSSADNEVWSCPPHVEEMMVKYIHIRDSLKDYIREAMAEAHEKGTPVIKALFYDFPHDTNCWENQDEYLFGHDLLVAPVMEANVRERKVYLPAGCDWADAYTGELYSGGAFYEVDAPLDKIPVFAKAGCGIRLK